MWFKKALTICTAKPDQYYTVADLIQYYEWKFTQTIPKGTVFTKQLPPSQTVSDKIIIAATVPPEILLSKSGRYELKGDIQCNAVVRAGQILSPVEVLEKYKQLEYKFNRKLAVFQESLETQPYIISTSEDKQVLLKVNEIGDKVQIANYGDVKDLQERLTKHLHGLEKQSNIKKWRSFEKEQSMKFKEYLSVLADKQIAADSTKMEYLLKMAHVQPINEYSINVMDLFLRVSPDAQNTKKQIELFQNASWVTHSKNYMQSAN